MLSLSDLPTVNGGVPGYYGVVVDPTFRGAFPGVELRDGLSVRPVAGNRLRHLVAAIGRQIKGFWRCWPDGTPVVGGERVNAPDDPPTLLPFVGPVLAQDRKPEGADEPEPNPKEDTPEEDTPEEDTPEEDTPEEDTPEEDTPEEDTPEEDTPEAAEAEFGADPFAEMDYSELRERAKEAEVPEFWKLDTEELRGALRKASG